MKSAGLMPHRRSSHAASSPSRTRCRARRPRYGYSSHNLGDCGHHRFHDGKPRAKHDAAEERVADNEQKPHRRSGTAPAFGGDEPGFRIEIGIGEMSVVVMAQMRFAIHRVGKPDRERGDAEQCVKQGKCVGWPCSCACRADRYSARRTAAWPSDAFSLFNALLGVAPLAVWFPYAVYRESHLRHHNDAHLTDPDLDPETWFVSPNAGAVPERRCGFCSFIRNTFFGRIVLGPWFSIVETMMSAVAQIVRGIAVSRAPGPCISSCSDCSRRGSTADAASVRRSSYSASVIRRLR